MSKTFKIISITDEEGCLAVIIQDIEGNEGPYILRQGDEFTLKEDTIEYTYKGIFKHSQIQEVTLENFNRRVNELYYELLLRIESYKELPEHLVGEFNHIIKVLDKMKNEI